MIKYKITDANGNDVLVDIKGLEDRYYWSEYDNYPTFTQWMVAHEKDGSVTEVDVLTDDELKEIGETAIQLRALSDKLYDLFTEVDGISIDENIEEFRVLGLIDVFVRSVISNAYKLERAH